jgi:hypothetical protein
MFNICELEYVTLDKSGHSHSVETVPQACLLQFDGATYGELVQVTAEYVPTFVAIDVFIKEPSTGRC